MNGFIEVHVHFRPQREGAPDETHARLFNVAHIKSAKAATWWDSATETKRGGTWLATSDGSMAGQTFQLTETYDEVKALIATATRSLPPADVQKYVADSLALRARYAAAEAGDATDLADNYASLDECADDLACEAQRMFDNLIGLS